MQKLAFHLFTLISVSQLISFYLLSVSLSHYHFANSSATAVAFVFSYNGRDDVIIFRYSFTVYSARVFSISI